MGPTSVRSRRCWRISSWPAAKGMAGSRAVPIATAAPSGTNRPTASAMVVTFTAGGGRAPYSPGGRKRSTVTDEPALESSQRGAPAALIPQPDAAASTGAATEPPAGSTTSIDWIVGLASSHQLLHVTRNQAEPFAGGCPNAGSWAPGTSSTGPASAGSASARFLAGTVSPLSSSSVTLRGVPVSQHGSAPVLTITIAPTREPPAPWKPRNSALSWLA